VYARLRMRQFVLWRVRTSAVGPGPEAAVARAARGLRATAGVRGTQGPVEGTHTGTEHNHSPRRSTSALLWVLVQHKEGGCKCTLSHPGQLRKLPT
jgi:hypothetical protein